MNVLISIRGLFPLESEHAQTLYHKLLDHLKSSDPSLLLEPLITLDALIEHHNLSCLIDDTLFNTLTSIFTSQLSLQSTILSIIYKLLQHVSFSSLPESYQKSIISILSSSAPSSTLFSIFVLLDLSLLSSSFLSNFLLSAFDLSHHIPLFSLFSVLNHVYLFDRSLLLNSSSTISFIFKTANLFLSSTDNSDQSTSQKSLIFLCNLMDELFSANNFVSTLSFSMDIVEIFEISGRIIYSSFIFKNFNSACNCFFSFAKSLPNSKFLTENLPNCEFPLLTIVLNSFSSIEDSHSQSCIIQSLLLHSSSITSLIYSHSSFLDSLALAVSSVDPLRTLALSLLAELVVSSRACESLPVNLPSLLVQLLPSGNSNQKDINLIALKCFLRFLLSRSGLNVSEGDFRIINTVLDLSVLNFDILKNNADVGELQKTNRQLELSNSLLTTKTDELQKKATSLEEELKNVTSLLKVVREKELGLEKYIGELEFSKGIMMEQVSKLTEMEDQHRNKCITLIEDVEQLRKTNTLLQSEVKRLGEATPQFGDVQNIMEKLAVFCGVQLTPTASASQMKSVTKTPGPPVASVVKPIPLDLPVRSITPS
ncbi:hypothetical protein RCL1_003724 [Eukaryota sp. TZLM3-RCL]